MHRLSLDTAAAALLYLWVCILAYEALTAPPATLLLQDAQADRDTSLLLYGFAAAVLFVVILRLIYDWTAVKYALATRYDTLLVFLIAGAISLISLTKGNFTAFAYSILFIAILTFSATLYIRPDIRLYRNLALLFSVALVLFLIVHGMPNRRFIGGIHPNHIGGFALAAVFFGAIANHWSRFAVYALAFSFCILVNSRYAILSVTTIVIFDVLSRQRLTYFGLFSLTLFLFVIALCILIWGAQILDSILLVDDPYRGLGSGIAGRAYMWPNFQLQIWQHPLIGFGFRERGAYYPTHNGFLNFALQNGLLLAMLLSIALVAKLWSLLRSIAVYGDSRAVVAVGLFLAWCITGLFQPQIINFGDAFAVMTAFFLTMPPLGLLERRILQKGADSVPR